jgi:5-formyltetrahydrofolate cyclo-ligase
MRKRFLNKDNARKAVWDHLQVERVARFPFPPHGRIPNFAGAEQAATRLFELSPWKNAKRLKINPDSPQRPVREEALRRGIKVYVPTPRLRGGFMLFDPATIPPDQIRKARWPHDRQALGKGGAVEEVAADGCHRLRVGGSDAERAPVREGRRL